MKKMIKTLLISILTLSFITNVNADYAVGTELTVTAGTSKSTGINCIGCYAAYDANNKLIVEDSAHITQYSLSDGSSVYCMDAHLKSGSEVKVDSVIKSNTTDPYYAGLAAIGAAGYSQSITSYNGISGYDLYTATNLAIRMYAIAMDRGYNYSNPPLSSGAKYTRQLGNTAAKWMNENQSVSNKATGFNCSDDSCFKEKMKLDKIANLGSYKTDDVKSNVLSGGNKGVLDTAKKLFYIGLEAASKGSTGVSSASISDVQTSPSKTAHTSTQFVKKDYYTLSSSSDNLSAVSNLSATCTNCGSIKGNPTISLTGYSIDNGATFKTGVPTSTELSSNKSIILEISGTIDRNSGYDCTDVEYTINYDFASSSFDYTIYLLKSKSSDVQRFYGIVTGDVTDPDSDDDNPDEEVPKTMKFCDDNNKCEYYDPKDFEDMTEAEFEQYTSDCCTDIESFCNDASNPAKQDYCDMYDEYCGACDTQIVVPNACQWDGSDVNVTEGTSGHVISAVDDDGNKNIKACLLMRKKDEAGHSYKHDAFKNNAYCQVYCVEDFTFNLPDIKTVNSGTYFQLEATISGTKTCYTSKIDVEKFKNDISGLDETSQAYNDAVSNYNACVNMKVDYSCFDPQIEYEYEEIYNSQLGSNNKFVVNGTPAETDGKTTYCSGDIKDNYDCLGTSSTTAGKITINGKEYVTADYVKSTVKKTGLYKTPSVFYTQIDGNITTDATANNATAVNGLPVSLSTEKGRHQFTLKLSNIGEYYDKSSCDSGRVIGDTNSVFDKQNKDKGQTGVIKAEYMCFYDVNCPECDFDCDGPLCNIDQCDGVNCEPTCLGNGCAYTGAGLSYAYRTVSLNNLNPNESQGRKLGFNWSTDAKNKAATKVASAISEIETAGEAAYENDPLYSFTLTPSLINTIKTYNNNALSSGGYANDSLACEDYTYAGVTYKNVNCKSTFIEDLSSGAYGSVNVTVPSDAERFINWPESEYCKNNVCKVENGIGPSYK